MVLTSLVFMELLPRVELGTSSLPRMRSTTELKQHFLLLRRGRSLLSGKRDSNPRPPAWKASALSTELFPRDFRENLAGVLASANCESELSFASRKPSAKTHGTSACDLRRSGCGWIRTTEVEDSRFTVCPIWPLWNTPFVGIRLQRLHHCVVYIVAAIPPLKITSFATLNF